MKNNKKNEKPAVRNAIALVMAQRFGKTTTTMKDRRTPRGGNKNKQVAFLKGDYLWPATTWLARKAERPFGPTDRPSWMPSSGESGHGM